MELSPSRRWAAGLESRGPGGSCPQLGVRESVRPTAVGASLDGGSHPPTQGAGLGVLHKEAKAELRVATSSADRRHVMGMLPGPPRVVLVGEGDRLSWPVRGLVCSLCLAEWSCVSGNWVPTTHGTGGPKRDMLLPAPQGTPGDLAGWVWGWGGCSVLALAKPGESRGLPAGSQDQTMYLLKSKECVLWIQSFISLGMFGPSEAVLIRPADKGQNPQSHS